MVTSEDVCRNLRNVKLNDYVFQHAFYCHVCHCSLCTITALFNNMRTLKFKAQPTNAFFATVNQLFGGSSQLPTMLSKRFDLITRARQ